MKNYIKIILAWLLFLTQNTYSQEFGIKNTTDLNYSNSITTNTQNGQPFQVALQYEILEPESNLPCKSNLILEVNYSTNLSISSTSIANIVSNGFMVVSSSEGNIKMKKNEEASGFSTIGNGIISFTPVILNCEDATSTVIYKLYYECINGDINNSFETLEAIQSVNIQNANTQPSILISKIVDVPECNGNRILYKVTSFGKSEGSYIKLYLPVNSNVNNVYNTSGNIIPHNYSIDDNILDFARDNDELKIMQEFYIDIEYTNNLICDTNYTLQGQLVTYDFCDSENENQVFADTDYLFASCSCEPAGGQSGEIVINPTDGGALYFSKKLNKIPFRYVGFPENCKEHYYELQLTNFSNQTISDFSITDYIAAIIPATNTELKITKLEISYSNLNPFDTNEGINFQSLECATIPQTALLLNQPFSITDDEISFEDCIGTDEDGELKLSFDQLYSLGVITIKIYHKLMYVTPQDELKNEAKLALNGNNYFVKIYSTPDTYKPIVAVSKKVRNVTQNQTGYSNSVIVSEGDQLEFLVTVANYGLAPATNFSLTDVLSNNSNDYTIDQTSFTFENTSGTTINFNSNGFTFNNNSELPASTCENGFELKIKYKVNVANAIICNSNATNKVVVNYDSLSQPIESNINFIKTDLFRGIDYKYVVTNCNNQEVRATNITPGDILNFKIVVRNQNTTAKNIGFQLALPVAQENISYGSLNVVSTPGVTNISISQDTFAANSTGLTPNFLTSSSTSITGSNALEWKGTIAANTTKTITFSAIVPVNATQNTLINSDFAIAINPNSECAQVKKRTVSLSVNRNSCNTPTQICENVAYEVTAQKISDAKVRIKLNFLETNPAIQYVAIEWNDLIFNSNNYLVYYPIFQNLLSYGTSFADSDIYNKKMQFYTGSIQQNDEIQFDLTIDPLDSSNGSFSGNSLPLTISFNGSNLCNYCEKVENVSIENGLYINDSLLQQIKVMPNPTNNFITINSNSFETIKTYTILGQEIFPTINKNSENTIIDFSKFSDGIYFIKIVKDNSQKTIKIIKQ